MPQSLASILVHLIFSTKNRLPLITPKMEDELHPYMTGILQDIGCPLLAIGGMPDHVHILFNLGRTTSVADAIKEVKGGSSRWVGAQFIDHFAWQAGYGAFSIGESGVKHLKDYIANQPEHHRARTFQDEFRAFLKKYDVPYDERYVWD